MIEVEQSINAVEIGDCYRACVASIFEIPLREVPNFVLKAEGIWWEETCKWFWERLGLQPVYFNYDFEGRWEPYGYAILSADLEPLGIPHAMVTYNGKVVWNPAPGNKEFVVRKYLGWTIFHVLDYSKGIRK